MRASICGSDELVLNLLLDLVERRLAGFKALIHAQDHEARAAF